MNKTIIVSALVLGTIAAVSAYVLLHDQSVAPVAFEPEEVTQDDLESAITRKSIHIRDTLALANARLQVEVDKRDNAHAHLIHSRQRAVLPMPAMVEYPDGAAERDMYKQMARERIDVALDQYRHGSAGK